MFQIISIKIDQHLMACESIIESKLPWHNLSHHIFYTFICLVCLSCCSKIIWQIKNINLYTDNNLCSFIMIWLYEMISENMILSWITSCVYLYNKDSNYSKDENYNILRSIYDESRSTK